MVEADAIWPYDYYLWARQRCIRGIRSVIGAEWTHWPPVCWWADLVRPPLATQRHSAATYLHLSNWWAAEVCRSSTVRSAGSPDSRDSIRRVENYTDSSQAGRQ